MLLGLGPRFAFEAAFLVAVAVAAAILSLSTPTIVAVMAGSWLLVATVEWAVSRRAAGRELKADLLRASAAPVAEPAVEPETVVVLTDAGRAAPESAPPPPPEPELVAVPEPEAEPEPEPEAVAAEPPEDEEEEEEEEAVAVPEPEPEPELVAVPEPAAEPEPEPEPVVATAGVISLAAWGSEPREWNLWDLEQAMRAAAGENVERDQERTFLLLYLREFAGPDGSLPTTFDALIRDSFGDLLGSGAR